MDTEFILIDCKIKIFIFNFEDKLKNYKTTTFTEKKS